MRVEHMTVTVSTPSRVPWARMLALATLIALVALMLARGHGFYGLELEARRDHPDFRVLSPTGLVGQGYGVVAAALIVANLAYLVRRRFSGAQLGAMRGWLDMHVITGLTALVFVAFHSAFQLRSMVAIAAAASVVIVAVTGAVGRYFHHLAPRTDAVRLRESLQAMDRYVVRGSDMAREVLARMPRPSAPAPGAGLAGTLAMIPAWRREARARSAAIRALRNHVLPYLDRKRRRRMRKLYRVTQKICRRQVASAAACHLLRVWRDMHRLFALLMLAATGLHVGVAWYYGYRWIWTL